MKTKILALALAILMAAALIPFTVSAETEEDLSEKEAVISSHHTEEQLKNAASIGSPGFEEPAEGGEEQAEKPVSGEKDLSVQTSINDAANDLGTFFDYSFSNMTSAEDSTYSCVQSTNAGSASSTAYLRTETFQMVQNETLSFYYWFETETNYDKFTFSSVKDGTATAVLNGLSGNSGGGDSPAWVRYTYTCSQTGSYYFEWKYVKDGSSNVGEDCIKIAQVSYSAHVDMSRDLFALSKNGESGAIRQLDWTGDYPFAIRKTTGSHPDYIYSGNGGVPNSTSDVVAYVYVPSSDAATVFSFDYAYSTEQNYDMFRFYLDGEQQFAYSGTDDYSWHTHTLEIEGFGMHTLKWEYKKDVSNNGGNDVVCLDNFKCYTNARGTDREYFYYAYLTSTSSSEGLIYNTPAGYEAFVPSGDIAGNDVWVSANNRCRQSSQSAIETMINMDAGETLSFQYFVSTESYDSLKFYVNGTAQSSFSGWNNILWRTYTFTAPSRGCYTFRWVYTKDSSIDQGRDLVLLDSVCYTGSFHGSYTLSSALNSYDTDEVLQIETDTYNYGSGRFMPVYGEIGSAVSRNRYWESTEARLFVYTFQMRAGDTFSFDYKADSEFTDKLTITLLKWAEDDTQTIEINGESGASWTRYTMTAQADGSYAATFTFTKDSTVNSGLDCAMLRDFAITHYNAGILGDVDGSGVVNANDALLLLRYTMNLTAASALDLSVADFDGSGSVNVNDALLIMRHALGFA